MAEKYPLVARSKTATKWRDGWGFEVAGLSFATVILLATFTINGFAGAGDPSSFGFSNSTGNISDEYYTAVTPAGWTFSLWGIIYFGQALWILYAWTIVCRPWTKRTIFPAIYLIYSFTNICNITWLYLWGNDYIQVAFPFLFLVSISLWCSFGVQTFYLKRVASSPPNERLNEFKFDYYLSQIIVVNGIAIYATWTTIANLINLSAVLEYYGDYDGVNIGTIALSLLAFELSIYFILENIILDKLHRFVFIVYPVVIWALSGVISAQGTDERNGIFSVVLLSLTCVLLVIRCVLWIIYIFGFRPISSTKLFKYKHVV